MSEERIYDRIGHISFKVGSLETDIYAVAANLSTLANFLLGTLISLKIIIGDPLEAILAMRFLMLGASFDAIDGRLARRSNKKPRLGAQFDTAADLVTFGIAPAMMIFHRFGAVNDYYGMMLAAMYLFGASYRLSRFMLEPTYGYFTGMPSPVAASYIGAWYMLNSPDLILFAAATALISTVMIVSLPYTAMKTVGTWYNKIYFVFTVSMMLLLTYAPSSWMEVLGTIWIIFLTYFTIIGPRHARISLNLQKVKN